MEIIGFKKANCKNCYKCIRECPVKAIAFKGQRVEIIKEQCILCGRCMIVCPQNAKEVRNDTDMVKIYIASKQKVVASIAPSFISVFPVSGIKHFEKYINKLGFFSAEEASRGAYVVTKEYEKFVEKDLNSNIISSACSSIVSLIQKYHIDILKNLAPVVSPMIAHAMMLKKKYGDDTMVIFIGPCISKKAEGEKYAGMGIIDGVLTFDELEEWFKEEGISFDDSELSEQNDVKGFLSRFYPKSGGIIKSMKCKKDTFEYVHVDGIEKCRKVLDSISKKELKGYFIEMSACEGSCINGPCVRHPKGGLLKSQSNVEKYALSKLKSEDLNLKNMDLNLKRVFNAEYINGNLPGEKALKEILLKTGKVTNEMELNCGACGYSTCREKAIAVYQGKAELQMCLPYMRDRAESISDKIINSSPNAIIALDANLKVQQINISARKLFGWENQTILGMYIGKFLDSIDFLNVIDTGKNIVNKKTYYPMYGKHVEQSIVYVKEHELIFGIMKDITLQENQNEKIKKVKYDTVNIANNVIEKQMRVVQEIASLLGETTAETKIALTRLKDTIVSEEG